MTAPTTQKRIIFVGSYLDLFNALQAAREQQDNERVTDALMEHQADDRQAVDEAPWMLGALSYGDMDLEQRRNEILSTYKEATPEAQKALIDELAEIETRLD
jgi:hypothetical protein